jgi:hypothetical protein
MPMVFFFHAGAFQEASRRPVMIILMVMIYFLMVLFFVKQEDTRDVWYCEDANWDVSLHVPFTKPCGEK